MSAMMVLDTNKPLTISKFHILTTQEMVPLMQYQQT